MDDADICPGKDLKAAAERHTMRGGNHRNRQLAPTPGHMLRRIGLAMAARRKIIARRALALFDRRSAGLHRRQIQPGTKGAAFAGQNDNAEPLGLAEFRNRIIDAGKHGGIERVHLVGADQADVGNAVFQHSDGNAVIHECFPFSANSTSGS
jgi:hypothetical protein